MTQQSSQQTAVTVEVAETTSSTEDLYSLLPGWDANGEGTVQMTVPPLEMKRNESQWEAFLTNPNMAPQRAALTSYLRAVLELSESAKSTGTPLADVAREKSVACRKCLAHAWVDIRTANRDLMGRIDQVGGMFDNLGAGRRAFQGKIYAKSMKPDRLAKSNTQTLLDRHLAKFSRRPNPTNGRGFILLLDNPADSSVVQRLGEMAFDHKALLVCSTPSYDTMAELRAASSSGDLQHYAGEQAYRRNVIVLGNEGRVRHGLKTELAPEEDDFYVSPTAHWFGGLLKQLAQGQAWVPNVGYQFIIQGFDGIRHDLLLEDEEIGLLGDHRINPLIRLSEDSDKVVVWGADSACAAGDGVQIGVAVVQTLLVRYAEMVINKYGLLTDLSRARRVVEQKLSRFMRMNSGRGRMFQAGSTAEVVADKPSRQLIVKFRPQFREVTERAVIKLTKEVKKNSGRGTTAVEEDNED